MQADSGEVECMALDGGGVWGYLDQRLEIKRRGTGTGHGRHGGACVRGLQRQRPADMGFRAALHCRRRACGTALGAAWGWVWEGGGVRVRAREQRAACGKRDPKQQRSTGSSIILRALEC